MARLVYVEGNDKLVEDMFIQRNWIVTDKVESSDLICFTGGADVSPMLYECIKLSCTNNDLQRDEECANLFHRWVDFRPMVGICRGAQFLNVMAGGDLYQDVNGHALGDAVHDAIDVSTGQIIDVTSTHHQMMIPLIDDEAEVILVANEATEKRPSLYAGAPDQDTECVYYHSVNALCYQPHPEYVEDTHECREFFFNLIEQYLF